MAGRLAGKQVTSPFAIFKNAKLAFAIRPPGPMEIKGRQECIRSPSTSVHHHHNMRLGQEVGVLSSSRIRSWQETPPHLLSPYKEPLVKPYLCSGQVYLILWDTLDLNLTQPPSLSSNHLACEVGLLGFQTKVVLSAHLYLRHALSKECH